MDWHVYLIIGIGFLLCAGPLHLLPAHQEEQKKKNTIMAAVFDFAQRYAWLSSSSSGVDSRWLSNQRIAMRSDNRL